MGIEMICKWNYDKRGNICSIDYDATELSLPDGFAIWRNGQLNSLTGDRCRWGNRKDGPHWGIVVSGTMGTGNHGRAFLAPRSPEARRLVREATIERWTDDHGFSRDQAVVLFELPLRFKQEMLANISQALKDPIMVQASAAWPGVGPGLHKPWMDYWSGAYKRHLEKIPSWPRRAALIEAVRAMS